MDCTGERMLVIWNKHVPRSNVFQTKLEAVEGNDVTSQAAEWFDHLIASSQNELWRDCRTWKAVECLRDHIMLAMLVSFLNCPEGGSTEFKGLISGTFSFHLILSCLKNMHHPLLQHPDFECSVLAPVSLRPLPEMLSLLWLVSSHMLEQALLTVFVYTDLQYAIFPFSNVNTQQSQ